MATSLFSADRFGNAGKAVALHQCFDPAQDSRRQAEALIDQRAVKLDQAGPCPDARPRVLGAGNAARSEEHTSELQSLMRISYAVFCLKKKKHINSTTHS